MASSRLLLPFLAVIFMIFTFCGATEILVGGKENSWTVPKNSSESLNQWAEKTRFKVGDVLVWKYDNKDDSVLEVKKEDYKNCNTSKPIKEYKDGSFKVTLSRSGPYYYISGADGNCQKGEKLQVVVMSLEHSQVGSSPTKSPTPAPMTAPSPTKNGARIPSGGRLLGAFVGFAYLLSIVM